MADGGGNAIMAGLDPAIEAPRRLIGRRGRRVDGQVEPGHDERVIFAATQQRFRVDIWCEGAEYSPARKANAHI